MSEKGGLTMRLIDADKLPVVTEWCVDEAGFGASFHVVHEEDINNAPTIELESLRPKPQNNADRLRTMTDEELANFLASKFAEVQASNTFTEEMPPTATQLSAAAHFWYCAWMQWLRQPIRPNCGAKMKGE